MVRGLHDDSLFIRSRRMLWASECRALLETPVMVVRCGTCLRVARLRLFMLARAGMLSLWLSARNEVDPGFRTLARRDSRVCGLVGEDIRDGHEHEEVVYAGVLV